MKIKITLLLLFCSIFCVAQKTTNKCHIIGDLTNTPSDTIIALLSDRQDTIILKNGKFDYSFKSNRIANVTLLDSPLTMSILRSGRKINSIELIIMPDLPMEINGSFENYEVIGSQFYKSIIAVQNEMKPFNKEINDLNGRYNSAYASTVNKDSLKKDLEMKLKPALKKRVEFILNYIKAHPDSEESATLIPTLGDKLDCGIRLLSKRVKASKVAEYYKPYKENMDKQKALDEMSKMAVAGKMAPDFVLKDIKGENFKLSSLFGKYVLLDFWGSWCHWCIKGMPDLKKYYERYQGKLEIVGVDCNDTEDKWRAAVEKNQLPWLHVKNDKTNDITVKYGVQGYPTLIIIAPNGKILKRFLGEEPDFYTTMDNIFK